MHKHLYIFFGLILSALPGGCGSKEPLPTVETVELQRYMGKWYEIARLPNRFEQGLKCVTATYELRDDGKVNVFNRGIDEQNPERVDEAKGKARMPDPTFPGRLKVSFFWPFSGDYFIIDLDDDYTLSLVGDPGRKYLWILARSPEPEQDSIDELVKKAASLGFPVELLHYPPHDCM